LLEHHETHGEVGQRPTPGIYGQHAHRAAQQPHHHIREHHADEPGPSGGIEFMRPWMEKVYGVPPEQVIGSSIKTKFEMRDGKPMLVRLPEPGTPSWP
jgi:hypothetical protein